MNIRSQQLWIKVGLTLILCALAQPVFAQAAQLQLSVRKNFGYNNGSDIQGSFRVAASGPANLTSVTFTIDGETLGVANAAPFQMNFDTGQYAPGWHTLGAAGQTADGQTLTAGEKRFNFLSSAQANANAMNLVFPILGIVGLVVALTIGSQVFMATRRNKTALPLGAARQYGLLGGAICPKCQRPFSIHWWGLNAGITQKFDRCDHCGKWSLVHAASRAELARAEAAEMQQARPAEPIAEMSAEEKLKRDLDSSRFLDH